MADLVICERPDIVAIADAVRNKTGQACKMTIGEIANSINRITVGGDTSIEDAFVTKTLINYTNSRVSCIGSSVFGFYSSLTAVSFPACTTIGAEAFSYCYSLTTVNFPVCTTIGNSAFNYCTNLTTVSFPVCTTIGSDAFEFCSSLTTVSFPACATIGNYAFHYCTNLTTVSFPVCTTISGGAFCRCPSLTTVSFPVCTTIGNVAFYSCSRLTTVSFPVCTTIGDGAFEFCSRLTTVYLLASSLCALGHSSAFSGCTALTSIYVPASLLTSYKNATNWTYLSDRFAAVEDSPDWDGVYGNGGGTEPETPSNTITFYIDGAEYQAEEGMTWGEWCDSDYNSYYSTIMFGSIVNNRGDYVCHKAGLSAGPRVNASEVIESEAEYVIG